MNPAMIWPLDVASAIGTLGVAFAVIGSWWRWGRPRWVASRREAQAVRDVILGRDAIPDSITGEAGRPQLPGIGQRMAIVEQQLPLIAETLGKIADSLEDREVVHTRIENLEGRVSDLEHQSFERIAGKAESVQMFKTIEAVAKSTPPPGLENQ